jgi:hypothetical protein
MLGTSYYLRRGICQIFLRELQSLPADSNDIHVRTPTHVDIAVLFFWGTGILYGWTQCEHTFYLVKIAADSHNVRKSGQQYRSRGVRTRTGISSFSLFKNLPLPALVLLKILYTKFSVRGVWPTSGSSDSPGLSAACVGRPSMDVVHGIVAGVVFVWKLRCISGPSESRRQVDLHRAIHNLLRSRRKSGP